MEICEKVCTSLWILLVGILRSNKFLMVALCIVHVIPAIMLIGVKLSTRVWVSDVCSMSYFHNFFCEVSMSNAW